MYSHMIKTKPRTELIKDQDQDQLCQLLTSKRTTYSK